MFYLTRDYCSSSLTSKMHNELQTLPL